MEDSGTKPHQSWLDRLMSKLRDEPETTEELIESLRAAFSRKLLDEDTFSMVEGVLTFSKLKVRDVMVSRSQMDVIHINESLERIIEIINQTTHSRFPVIGEDKDDILGILHAKHLLPFFAHPERFNLKDILRPARFVTESKSLSTLLKECRNKDHLVLVVEEYGGVSGLITMEDLIEEIIGEIEDELDQDDSADNITELAPNQYRVKATTEIDDFNTFFNTEFSDEEVDTIGGLVIQELGRMPEKGEKVQLGNLNFTVSRVDARRLHLLTVSAHDN